MRAATHRQGAISPPAVSNDLRNFFVDLQRRRKTLRNRLFWLLLAALVFVVGFGSRADAFPIYFVVAESGTPVHGDSYILPLENPDQIAHARDLIVRGPGVGSPIAVARIAMGSDGINRDFLAPGEPLWSWHVTQFEGFADATIELIDGWPTFVEQDVDGWIANTNGFIGFWHYTVVAELSTIPEPGTFVLLAGGLGG